MTRAALAISIVVLGACVAPVASKDTAGKRVPPPNLAKPAKMPPPGYLVWTGGVDGETVWLDADGTERGRAGGVVVALRATLWQLGVRQERYEVSTCSKSLGKPGPRGDGTGWVEAEIQELAPIGRPRDDTYPLNSTWWGGGGMAGTKHHAVLTGQVGRFIFLTERTESDTCEAEALVSVIGRTYDLVRGYASEPLIDGDTEERLRKTARTALISELVNAGVPAEGEAYLGDARPTWRDGVLGLDHLFWMATCPTCADREWSTATVATWVTATALPAVLTDYVEELPEAVRARLSSATGAVGVSWGYPDELWTRTFAAAR